MSASDGPKGGIAIHLNCPHCHSPIELASGALVDEILCSSCGSSFQIDTGRTQTWSRDKLPKLDKFELIEEVGRGAFGTVYRARDTQLDRIVAVKVPRSGQLATDEDEERFVREGRNVAQLQHPGIVPVYEVGRGAMFPYIVCEFIDGSTLADILTTRKFGFRESARLAAQVAEALDHAHAHGVVHRDLKPSNIMITLDGQPRVMDFGMAKRDAGEITVTLEGQVLGTPAYMSPEQAAGQAHHVDGRSDVYSLGSILYELLTGELPFRGNQRMLLNQVLKDEPRSPRSLNDRIPRDLETICQKAMAKEPSRRYQTAQAMADDLDRYLSGQPIAARPVGRVERARRWCQRNPVVASLSSAVVLALVLGTIVSAYFAGDAVAQKRLAEQKAAEALANAEDARKAESRADQEAREARTSAHSASQAREHATQEAQRALVEAERASRVSQFLAGMFEASAPLSHGGFRFAGLGLRGPKNSQDTTQVAARELLDRGTKKVVDELQDQPAVQAALFDTIGNVYIGLGLTDQAEPLITSGLAIHRRLHPAPHLDTAASLCSLAALRFMQLRWDESADASRESLAIRRQLLGANHKDTVDVKFMLAFALAWGTFSQEPEELLKDVIAWRAEHLGKEHPETAIAMFCLAGTLLKRNEDVNQAVPLLTQAISALKKDPQTRPLGLAMGEVGQARILWTLNQFDAAAALTAKAVEHFLEFETDEHPMFAYVVELHLMSLQHAKRFDEAKKFCRDRIQRLRNAAGPSNPFFAHALARFVEIVLLMDSPDDLNEAEDLCRTELRKLREPSRPKSINEADLAEILAQVLVAKASKAGESAYIDEAEQLYRQCLSIHDQFNVAPSFELMMLMESVAGPVGRRDQARAEALYRQAIEVIKESIIRDRKPRPRRPVDPRREARQEHKLDADLFVQIVLALGSMLERDGKAPQAETLYLESLPFTRQQMDAFSTMRMTKALADVKQSQGKSEDAENAYRDSLKLAEQFHPLAPATKGTWVSSTQYALANCLLAQGKKKEAEEMYRGALAHGDKDVKAAAQAKLAGLFDDIEAK